MRKVGEDRIENVDEGYANPELAIPDDISLGDHRLTAKYNMNDVYDASIARALVFVGYKTYIHCPPIYVTQGSKQVTLKAFLCAGNRLISYDASTGRGGKGIFKINSKTATGYIRPVDGYITGDVDFNFSSLTTRPYQCSYSGDTKEYILGGRDENNIYVVEKQKGKIPIIVDVYDTIITLNDLMESDPPITANLSDLSEFLWYQDYNGGYDPSSSNGCVYSGSYRKTYWIKHVTTSNCIFNFVLKTTSEDRFQFGFYNPADDKIQGADLSKDVGNFEIKHIANDGTETVKQVMPIPSSETEYNFTITNGYLTVTDATNNITVDVGEVSSGLYFYIRKWGGGNIILSSLSYDSTAPKSTIPLNARVYKRDHSSVVDITDVVTTGSVEFSVDGEIAASVDVNESGFASTFYNGNPCIGVHEIIATYNPPSLSSQYGIMSGAGTLFVMDDNDKPIITELSKHETTRGSSVEFKYSSDIELDGAVSLIIDSDFVEFLDGTTSAVVSGAEFSLSFNVPSKPTTNKLWAYGGQHYMQLTYTRNDGMKYYYYLSNLNILREVALSIEQSAMEDDTLHVEYTSTSDDTLLAVGSKNAAGEDRDIIIGGEIDFIVTDADIPSSVVNEGELQITLKSHIYNKE